MPGRPAPVSDDPVAPPPEPVVKSQDGPHISRSGGKSGGIVVFWPRVIPKTDDPEIKAIARKLQNKVAGVAEKVVGKKRLDIRPEPERVCPQSGCKAMTVGVLLTHSGGGCTAIALISGSGKAAAKLAPWSGKVDLKRSSVPFREYPESEVTIRDAVPCDQLVASLDGGAGNIRGAIKAAFAAEK